MKDVILNFLDNKKILILGFGREGKSLYDFLTKNHSSAAINIADKAQLEDVKTVSDTENLEQYDLIVKSPGYFLPPEFPATAKEKITCLTDLFLEFSPAPIVGVTATKGKSTTSSLVEHILKKHGKEVILLGNIGKACFGYVDEITTDTTVVFELSSQQLEYTKHSPHVAILINIFTDHIDYHGSVAEYAKAKKNIFKYQTEKDLLIYGQIFNENRTTQAELDACPAKKIDLENQTEINLDEIETLLVGEHNKKDIVAAVLATEFLGIDRQSALESTKDFSSLPHRLENVGTYHDITFYNDSIATNQEAVIAGIKALPNLNTILVGGARKGFKYDQLVNFLVDSQVTNILLLPDTDEEIQALFDQHQHDKNIVHIKDIEEGIKLSFDLAPAGSAVSLEPAATSFNQFKNFEERGNVFRALVKKYGQKN